MDNKALRDAWTGQLLCQRCKQPVERMAQHFDVLLLAWCCPPSPLADDEDEDEPMGMHLNDDWRIDREPDGTVVVTSYPHRTFNGAERITLRMSPEEWAFAVAHTSPWGIDPIAVDMLKRFFSGQWPGDKMPVERIEELEAEKQSLRDKLSALEGLAEGFVLYMKELYPPIQQPGSKAITPDYEDAKRQGGWG